MKPGIREKNDVWEINLKLNLERKSVDSLIVGLLAITGQGCGFPCDGGREAGNPFGATLTICRWRLWMVVPKGWAYHRTGSLCHRSIFNRKFMSVMTKFGLFSNQHAHLTL